MPGSPSTRPNPYSAPGRTGRPPLRGGDFRDRRTGLLVFGLLLILLALLALAVAALIPVAQVVAARTLGQEARLLDSLPSVLVYGLLGGALAILGVGSMRARRWARNLVLVVSWAWLVSGILSLLAVGFLLPGLVEQMGGAQGLPEGGAALVMGVVLGFVFLFFVLVPGALVLFYRSRHVRRTCEAESPPDWTEDCPLPVLTLSLWLFVTALFFLVTPISVRGTMPFFGRFISGTPGYLLYWGIAMLWGYGAYGLYKLREGSWWAVFYSTLVLGVSYLVTFSILEPIAMYELMGYGSQELAAMRQLGFASRGPVVVWILAFFVPYLAYLIYVKRYLSPARA